MAATSFAAYASQYLTRQQPQPERGATSTVMSGSTSQPMFFSFTTDNDEGSRRGGAHDSDLDDFDDPHLGLSMGDEAPKARVEQDDEDPYLRLDEEEDLEEGMGSRSRGAGGFRQQQHHQQSIPLIARSMSPASPPGWLAHLAQSPPRRQSPSNHSDSDSSPPPDLFVAASPRGPAHPPIPQTYSNTEPHSLSLTDSLLPRDGLARPLDVFTLPDPRHTPRKRRKHHDAAYISVFLSLLCLCLFFCLLLLITTDRPAGVPAVILPYAIMLRTVPILVILTFVSAAAAYAHVWALRLFVGPVMAVTEVFVPATLFVCAVWAFVGSFMWDGDEVPTWGETVGLRLFSIVPLVLCLLTARRLLYLPKRIHMTSSTLTLATHILMANPFLLALSPALLIGMLILSIPFMTMVFRLLLIGYTTSGAGKSGMEWHVRAWANWAIVGVLGVWFWSWAVARGVLRTTCASVVGAWYFADPTLPPPPPTSTHTMHAALTRSTGPSLGSIILASLILTCIRILTLTTLLLQRLPPLLLRIPWVPLAMPVAMYVVPGVRGLSAWLEARTERVSGYALVYVGLTGVGFWEGAGRGRGLVGSGRERVVADEGMGNGNGQRRRQGRAEGERQAQIVKKRFGAEPPLALLTISPLTLTFPFALLTYLFVAHTLGAPHEALGAALLAGGVTAIVGLFCVGVVRDTADTLYMCYCIDKAEGVRRREEVFVAFEYGAQPQPQSSGAGAAGTTRGSVLPVYHDQRGKGNLNHPQRPRHVQGQGQPETIIPRSPLSTRRNDGLGSTFDVGRGVGAGAGVGGREDTESEEEEEDGMGGGGGPIRQPPVLVPVHPKASARQVKKTKRSAPISPYRVGSDSEGDEEEDERTPTTTNVMRPPQTQSEISNLRMATTQQQQQEEEEEDLDPFKTSSTRDVDVDEEALLEGLGGGVSGGGYTSASPPGRRGSGAGHTSTSTSPPGRGVHTHGLGLAQGFNANLHAHRRSTSGGGGMGMGGLDFGVGPAALGGGGGASGFATAGGALAAAHRERMMTSTQELNMKSQFLMNMRGSESGSGYGADSGVSAGSASASASASANASAFGVQAGGSLRVAGEGGVEEESEGEESQLGPGSDFFNSMLSFPAMPQRSSSRPHPSDIIDVNTDSTSIDTPPTLPSSSIVFHHQPFELSPPRIPQPSTHTYIVHTSILVALGTTRHVSIGLEHIASLFCDPNFRNPRASFTIYLAKGKTTISISARLTSYQSAPSTLVDLVIFVLLHLPHSKAVAGLEQWISEMAVGSKN
ncbi:hypothetical protein CVT25_012823 [Psilocybe cyanescens]|uniref:Uncharacterized protein n=1 Tax=Psilocybe cyanescens TaxID=93625 RepID=A0A409XFB8_PSICY|nr:hypothetical protein CVT25_012823 [Psilocybe cyanescens]